MDFEAPQNLAEAKALGAYYTDSQIADFLVWWAVQNPSDTVMDPSFGGGVFLRSASEQLLRLGGAVGDQVFGVEIDPEVHTRIADKLHDGFGILKRNLILTDFFSLEQMTAPLDVIVGNPPFIRYQRFSGESRRRALERAAKYGLKLSELSSSWLPFLVHSIGLLRPGGRLAMVIPVEIGHAAYARPVLEFLKQSFAEVTFLTFKKKLFPDLSEDTLLVLADQKGTDRAAKFRWRDLSHGGLLDDLRRRNQRPLGGTRSLHTDRLSSGFERLIEYFIPTAARDLYRELSTLGTTKRLGELADVGIGYVTGGNDFFHLGTSEAKHWNIPDRFLRRAVRRGRSLSGLLFIAGIRSHHGKHEECPGHGKSDDHGGEIVFCICRCHQVPSNA